MQTQLHSNPVPVGSVARPYNRTDYIIPSTAICSFCCHLTLKRYLTLFQQHTPKGQKKAKFPSRKITLLLSDHYLRNPHQLRPDAHATGSKYSSTIFKTAISWKAFSSQCFKIRTATADLFRISDEFFIPFIPFLAVLNFCHSLEQPWRAFRLPTASPFGSAFCRYIEYAN